MLNTEVKNRRKHNRIPIELNLEVEEVFKQDHEVINNISAMISVFDISRSGIGFYSEAILPIGYYFKGTINFGDNQYFHVVIKILRVSSTDDDEKVYGAEFVGLAPFLADKVDRYEYKYNNNIE